MKDKKVIEQLAVDIQRIDEKIKTHIRHADQKLTNINAFNSFLDPKRNNFIKIKTIGNFCKKDEKSKTSKKKEIFNKNSSNIQNKKSNPNLQFDFSIINKIQIKLENKITKNNFSYVPVEKDFSSSNNLIKKKYSCNSFNKLDFVLPEAFTISSKNSVFEKIIFKTIKQIENFSEIIYERVEKVGDKNFSKILICQFENLEKFDLKNKFQVRKEKNIFFSKNQKIVSEIEIEKISTQQRNKSKLSLLEYNSNHNNEFISLQAKNFFSVENFLKICKIEEKTSKFFKILENSKFLRKNNFSESPHTGRSGSVLKSIEHNLKFVSLIAIDVKIYPKSRSCKDTTDQNFPHTDTNLNFIFEETSTKIFQEDPFNLNLKLQNVNSNRIKFYINKKKILSNKLDLNFEKISDLENIFIKKNISDSKLEKSSPQIKKHSKFINKSNGNIQIKSDLDAHINSDSFILISSNKFSKNFSYKNILNKLIEEFEKKKIKSSIIYQQSEKLFQGIDIILDNFTACILLKSNDFEDEFDSNLFEILYETINKNFFVYEKIYMILFSDPSESNSISNGKSLRNLENFVNKNFQKIKNFSSFAKIEIIKINRVNEVISLIEGNKKVEDGFEFKSGDLDLPDLSDMIQSVVKTSNFIPLCLEIRQTFHFFNFYQATMIICLINHDRANSENDNIDCYLKKLEKRFINKNIQIDRNKLFSLI